jgi:hypothetical protein
LVSVVIPCFNHGHFLAEAIESVLAQTHSPVEVIVVNDGSTDNTSEVAALYPQVRYLWQPNAGLSAARNTGLKSSRGKFICFLDADDLLYPGGLGLGLNCFARNPECAFVYGGHASTTSDLKVAWTRYPSQNDASYLGLVRGNRIAMVATVIFRRELLLSSGGFDEKLPCCEDYDVYLKLARKFPVAMHGGLVAKYRRHGSSLSQNAGLMLETSLGILQSQANLPRGNHRLRWSAIAGAIYFQRHYGFPLISQAAVKLWTGGERRQTATVLFQALCRAPWALSVPLTRVALRVVSKVGRCLHGKPSDGVAGSMG